MAVNAVQAEGLSKVYRLGRKRERQVSVRGRAVAFLRDSLGRGSPAPLLWALNDVSFEVKEGEVLGIIGRNGAGKSTLLKILSRLSEPTHGRAVVNGRLGSLLEVGTGFHPELTGRENVYLNGAILGMKRSEIDRKFDDIVEFAGVEAFLDTPVKFYSSGMYVRLAFAVSAHLEPDILIVDEVLAVGDVAFQQKCLGKMGDVASQGRTVLFVSHSMPSIKSLCTRAILLEGGRLVQDGDPDNVVAAYLRTDDIPRGQSQVQPGDSLMGTGEARLRTVTLLDSSDRVTEQLHFTEMFRVKMLVDSNARLPEVVIELGISTLDGVRVATMMNTDRGGHLFELTPGLQEIDVEVDVTLLPRDYVLDIGLHHYSGATIDLVEKITRFTVMNVAGEGGDHYRPYEVRGFVRPDTRWFEPQPAGEARRASGARSANK
ncbi:MAG TPA: ABC transporter ATP-binding protein [Candidatus Sulfotelmatobacter sp.]|nr:ABC transporter ATP-binding protein [Candidatus Sulfotelmatobacter sp.]